MTAAPVAIAKQRVKPSIRGASGGKVVDQLDVAIAPVESGDPGEIVQFGTDPRNPADSQTALITSITNITGSSYLTLQFLKRHNPVDFPLQYVPEVSADNKTWYSDVANVIQVSVTPVDSQFDQVIVRDLTPVTSDAPRFIRLRIIQN